MSNLSTVLILKFIHVQIWHEHKHQSMFVLLTGSVRTADLFFFFFFLKYSRKFWAISGNQHLVFCSQVATDFFWSMSQPGFCFVLQRCFLVFLLIWGQCFCLCGGQWDHERVQLMVQMNTNSLYLLTNLKEGKLVTDHV